MSMPVASTRVCVSGRTCIILAVLVASADGMRVSMRVHVANVHACFAPATRPVPCLGTVYSSFFD